MYSRTIASRNGVVWLDRWISCMQCASAERARARVRDDAGDYLCLCEAWKFSKCQEALQGTGHCFLLPKWVFRELTLRWLMWLAHCHGNSTVDILYCFLQFCRLLGFTIMKSGWVKTWPTRLIAMGLYGHEWLHKRGTHVGSSPVIPILNQRLFLEH